MTGYYPVSLSSASIGETGTAIGFADISEYSDVITIERYLYNSIRSVQRV